MLHAKIPQGHQRVEVGQRAYSVVVHPALSGVRRSLQGQNGNDTANRLAPMKARLAVLHSEDSC